MKTKPKKKHSNLGFIHRPEFNDLEEMFAEIREHALNGTLEDVCVIASIGAKNEDGMIQFYRSGRSRLNQILGMLEFTKISLFSNETGINL